MANYDRLAAHYESAMRPLDRWFLQRLRARVIEKLPPNGRLLEIGAGTGLNFRFYSEGSQGVATEPSGEMLSLARAKGRPSGVSLVQNCVENLPFADSSFDAAFATLVFCSVASPAEGFAELRRVVRKGGKIVLLEHVRPRGLLGPVFDLLSLVTVSLFDDHFNRRTMDEARAAGLEIVDVQRIGFGVFNLFTCLA
jgi:phosphatidylethanolamine/phosphatidyl-N-methylethanolamine N-methyltransferase